MQFEWDTDKNTQNIEKHGVSFYIAQYAFDDPDRIIARDTDHSTKQETRYFCIGKVEQGIITVRFTIRGQNIRIFGAGFWRKGRKTYEDENR